MKKYLEKNVLDSALERIEWAFNHFDSVYFSFSGGKDSSVMIQLANIVAKRLDKEFDVLYIDFEAQFKATIDHIYELKELSNIREFYHIALPMSLRNAVTQLQPKWICWDENDKQKWIRDLPVDSINMNNNPFEFFYKGMEFEEFIIHFARWYSDKHGHTGAGIGIRSQESLNRWRTIASNKKKTIEGNQWTTIIKDRTKELDAANFYPIYDWVTEDVWGAVSKLDLSYNQVYEMMYKNGLALNEQRLCQPFGDDQRNGLDQYMALEYETWEKLLERVNGVNFGNIYARTSALGNIKTNKPEHLNWEQYAIFLLESIGLYNSELMDHYIEKIDKFIAFYEKNEGIKLADIPDAADKKQESQKKVISWRRIARAIERNDFYMKRLSFSQNKSDEERLKKLVSKYDNLLSPNATNDKHLKQFYEREVRS
ncbi:phosphoadenosine phosphosulfate reductase [Marinilactibacillus sp. 15R]|uniref:phosphoadenosine phosphosulfate reductase n=1 Tax=Marinilactibacillus sp. 15R TaxID=1911586 RepID=UPI000A828563|nr:DUF3440 domain-containing protein [Marinilactibacillus sp. 15R]